MYVLLVSSRIWGRKDNTVNISPDQKDRKAKKNRMFEYTHENLKDSRLEIILEYPALIMEERFPWIPNQVVKVGRLTSVEKKGFDTHFSYELDPKIPEIPMDLLFEHKELFGIVEYEFCQRHMAMKDIDLYQNLLYAVVNKCIIPNKLSQAVVSKTLRVVS